MPHLLDIQTRAFESLLQLRRRRARPRGRRARAGLQGPVPDHRRQREVLPRVRPLHPRRAEVLRRGVHRARHDVLRAAQGDAAARSSSRRSTGSKRLKNIIEKEVYLGELPIMTPLGTFVINGAERVVVSQLHRSPGVVFEEATHPNGQRLFSARIIPFRGSWVEFTIDIHDVIYVHIDKKKKFPATALLRAFGYGTNADILQAVLRHARNSTSPASSRGRQAKRRRDHRRDIALPGEHGRRRAEPGRRRPAEREPLRRLLVGATSSPQERLNHLRHAGRRRRSRSSRATPRSTCATTSSRRIDPRARRTPRAGVRRGRSGDRRGDRPRRAQS